METKTIIAICVIVTAVFAIGIYAFYSMNKLKPAPAPEPSANAGGSPNNGPTGGSSPDNGPTGGSSPDNGLTGGGSTNYGDDTPEEDTEEDTEDIPDVPIITKLVLVSCGDGKGFILGDNTNGEPLYFGTADSFNDIIQLTGQEKNNTGYYLKNITDYTIKSVEVTIDKPREKDATWAFSVDAPGGPPTRFLDTKDKTFTLTRDIPPGGAFIIQIPTQYGVVPASSISFRVYM